LSRSVGQDTGLALEELSSNHIFDEQPEGSGNVGGWPKSPYKAFRYDDATGAKF